LKPWWQALLEALAGLWTQQQLSGVAGHPLGPKDAATGFLELPTGYVTPAPPPGLDESRDLAHCQPELVRRYLLLKADFQLQTGRCLVETSTWRSVSSQMGGRCSDSLHKN